jgi:RHS repeat-associated protein
MTVSAGATTLYDSGTLSYDGRENVTAVGPSTYEYDLLGRLISASVSTSSVPVDVYDLQYTYDPWGNLRDITKGVGGGSSIRSAVIDETSNQVESVNGTEWDVDSSGNVKSDGVLSYSWDAMGRLTAVANDSLPLVENEYDARGAKIRLRDYAEYRDTFYIRNYSGLVLSEYARPIDSTQPPEWSRDYVYADGSAVAVIMNSAPLEPAGISSWATGSAVFLSWMASSEIDHYGYHVYRASSPEGPFVRINTTGTVLGTQFTDADPLQGPPGTGLPGYYAIAAVDNAGTQSRYSSVRQITMGDATPPATPYGVQASTSSHHVGLSWAGGIESDFAGYDVYRSLIPTAQGGSFSKRNSYPLQSPSFSDNSVSNGVAYYYKIVSLDTAGNMSGFSSEISATPTGGGGGGGPCPPAGCIPYKEAYLYLRDCPSEEQAPRSPGEFWPCLRSSPTELLASAGNDYELRHLHLDHVGSVRASSDANGQVISKVDYLPFGEVIDAEATGEDRLRFNGYEVIPAIGKDYSYYRYYDWLSGRFLSPDPQSYMDGMQDPQHYNRYAFAANNPLTFSDPEGAAFRVSFGSTGVQIALDFLGHELNVNIAMNSDGGLTIVPLRGPLTPEQQKRQDLLMDISADPRVINLHLFDAGSDFIFYGATSSNGHALIDVADAKALDAVSNNTDFQPGVMMLHEMVEAAVKINAGARVQQLKSALDLAGKKYDAHVLTVFLGAPGLGNPTVVNFKRPIWPAPGAPVTLVEYGLTVTTPKKQTLWSLMILNPPWTHVPGQIGWKSGRILSTRGKQ